jgi:gamma-polyglutamate synthase
LPAHLQETVKNADDFLVPLAVIGGYLVCLALLARWGRESLAHRRRINKLDFRIHVNGIRGKSTVSRIIAGLLREGGIVTVAKSTGTAAAVINRDGVDEAIERKAAPTILEQIEVTKKYVHGDVRALVIECMALKPQYQAVSEKMIVRSNIGVITNIREDHQDVMGETLPEIARSLLNTCPYKGVLITSERNPAIVPIMEEVAAKRGTRLIIADPEWVTDEELEKFDYIAFKENVAIALAVAELAGIPRDVAFRGMWAAEPDPGVLRMKELKILGKRVTWANLFAVNDRESMTVAMEKLVPFMTPETTTVGILNNRTDRERRAVQFAEVAVQDLDFMRLVTFGAFEGLVTDLLVQNGYPLDHIINLGDTHSPPVETIVDRMIGQMPTSHVLVVGFVNIHTHQAEMMLDYFENIAEPWIPEQIEAD